VTRRAVVLARGLGTRMRARDPAAALSREQARAADAGLKPMMPVRGRPFLDFVLSALADSGIEDAGLIVAPDHAAIRDYYEHTPPGRIRVHYIVQREALGTANAVLAAETWCGPHPFLSVNADNLYPATVLRELATIDEPALAVFSRKDLIATSNIPAERIRAFALVEIDRDGYLARIVEKPDEDLETALISMNCWRFDAAIFDACRDVPRSARGEYELPEAVGLGVRRGARFRCIRAGGPVLDLSTRADAADVERRLAGVQPAP
jgi:glucose-1-phosphate thymidylyltransferase